MYRLVILLFCSLGVATASAEAEKPDASLQAGMVNPGYHEQPAWFKQSFLDIREDVQDAAASGKRVMLYFYQDGCPYCKKLLETNFGLRELAERTQKNMDVIAINLWGDREVTDFSGKSVTEKRFAEELKVMFTPTLVFLDEQGTVVMRLNGYYPPHKFSAVIDYVAQHKEKEIAFRDYWAELSPPASMGIMHQSEKYLQPPYKLGGYSKARPLLVLFEQKDCAHCDELHLDIFKREETRALLDGFDIVLLDMWTDGELETPDGKQTSVSDWARQLGIQYAPTMVMFDQGKEVFRTEAYLKAFHTQSSLDYVLSGGYKEQPNFQRYIAARADALEAQGIHVDLMQ